MVAISIALLLIALLAAGVVVARKFPYLKKLTPSSEQQFGAGWFWEFMPELRERYQRIDWVEYKAFWLREGEKFLRRLRLLFLKIDSFTNALIKRLSVSRLERQEEAGNGKAGTEDKATPPIIIPLPQKGKGELKKEEQALIIAIAKDPKNPELYRQLAGIYLELGNSTDAAESLRTAMQLDPEDSVSQHRLAEIEGKM